MEKVFVIIDGGIIQNVITTTNLDVTVIDYDTEGADLDDLKVVYGTDAYVSGPDIEINPQEAEALTKMIQDTEEEE